VWSAAWAALHQFAKPFRYALQNITFISVIIGCAGNLVIGFFFMDFQSWTAIVLVFAFSTIFVAARSLYDKQKESEQATESIEELRELIKQLRGVGGDEGETRADDPQEVVGKGHQV
jgi:hypothetical protein